MSYILRALDKEGNILFYTGCAGMNWLSNIRTKAFRWETREAAGWKAKHFNRMEPVHGYWFTVSDIVNMTAEAMRDNPPPPVRP